MESAEVSDHGRFLRGEEIMSRVACGDLLEGSRHPEILKRYYKQLCVKMNDMFGLRTLRNPIKRKFGRFWVSTWSAEVIDLG